MVSFFNESHSIVEHRNKIDVDDLDRVWMIRWKCCAGDQSGWVPDLGHQILEILVVSDIKLDISGNGCKGRVWFDVGDHDIVFSVCQVPSANCPDPTPATGDDHCQSEPSRVSEGA